MQAYFDRGDAELEHQAVVTRAQSHTDAESESRFNAFGQRGYRGLLGYAVGLALLAVMIAVHLGSAEQVIAYMALEPKTPETEFIIELPRPEPPKPKPKLKPKPEVKPEDPKPIERFRSIPDRIAQAAKPQDKLRERDEKQDFNRETQVESATMRALPAVTTPTIVAEETVDRREFAQADVRQVAVSDRAELRGGYQPVGGESSLRALPETGLSHIQLDPYHYQMVNVCLRLCVRTMFTHTGISDEEKNGSKNWLKIKREGDASFDYRYHGKWVRFHVQVGSLGEISNIDFVSIASDWVSSDGAQSLLEETTRELCRLLGYDDCFGKL